MDLVQVLLHLLGLQVTQALQELQPLLELRPNLSAELHLLRDRLATVVSVQVCGEPHPGARTVTHTMLMSSKPGYVLNLIAPTLTLNNPLRQMSEMRLTVDSLERERDFYYGKLREIEVLCQQQTDEDKNPVIDQILDILYATEDGFAVPDETSPDPEIAVVHPSQEEY